MQYFLHLVSPSFFQMFHSAIKYSKIFQPQLCHWHTYHQREYIPKSNSPFAKTSEFCFKKRLVSI